MKFQWILVPVSPPMTPFTVYEHTPAYAWKEYPRYIRAVRSECQTEWAKLYEDGSIVRPGEEHPKFRSANPHADGVFRG